MTSAPLDRPQPQQAVPGRPVPGPGAPRPVDPRPAAVRPIEAVRASVAVALAGLDEVAGRPAGEHVAAFERLHTALGEALAAGSPPDQVSGRA